MPTDPTLWDLLLGIFGLEPEPPQEDEAGALFEPGG